MSALFHAPRALTVKSPAIPIVAGQPALVPLKLEGTEGINSLFEYRLTLQTPDALNFMASSGSNFDLTAFVGLELSCFVELEGQGQFVPGLPGGAGAANQGAGVREISGLITEARFIGEDMPAQSIPFTIKTSSGETIQGVTDQEGRTPRIFGSQAESLELVLGGLQKGGLIEATAPSDSDGC